MPPMRTIALALFISILAASCGGKSTSKPGGAAVKDLSPALAPLAWWLGDWKAEDGSSVEHWNAVAGAIYGVSLQGEDAFEVMIVDDGEDRGKPDGILRFIAMPGGQRSVEFRQRTIADGSALFANDDHDFPKTIRYFAEGAALRATLAGDDERKVDVRFQKLPSARAPELEAADRAFAADTAKRGVDGWVDAFEPEGFMLRGDGEQIAREALADQMRPILTSGRLEWAPTASGANAKLGFTVGKATFTASQGGERRLTSYVTIWRKQANGTWKALFDTGRIVQD
jgi:ketosteroid isomerase-like protein